MPDSRVSIAQHYHERTKYHPETMTDRDYDWTKQPPPFKEYKIGATFDLKSHLAYKPENASKAENSLESQNWQRLSRFLFHSYGLTIGMVTRNGEPVYFR